MLMSGAQTPTTLNFLPDTHIVVVRAEQVVATYEDGWDRLRAVETAEALPRVVNFITGPSRTAISSSASCWVRTGRGVSISFSSRTVRWREVKGRGTSAPAG